MKVHIRFYKNNNERVVYGIFLGDDNNTGLSARPNLSDH